MIKGNGTKGSGIKAIIKEINKYPTGGLFTSSDVAVETSMIRKYIYKVLINLMDHGYLTFNKKIGREFVFKRVSKIPEDLHVFSLSKMKYNDKPKVITDLVIDMDEPEPVHAQTRPEPITLLDFIESCQLAILKASGNFKSRYELENMTVRDLSAIVTQNRIFAICTPKDAVVITDLGYFNIETGERI